MPAPWESGKAPNPEEEAEMAGPKENRQGQGLREVQALGAKGGEEGMGLCGM